jgi:hypothetical protein
MNCKCGANDWIVPVSGSVGVEYDDIRGRFLIYNVTDVTLDIDDAECAACGEKILDRSQWVIRKFRASLKPIGFIRVHTGKLGEKVGCREPKIPRKKKRK